jgi:hypothetical protein
MLNMHPSHVVLLAFEPSVDKYAPIKGADSLMADNSVIWHQPGRNRLLWATRMSCAHTPESKKEMTMTVYILSEQTTAEELAVC